MNVRGVPHHHIIYSGAGSLAPYFVMKGGQLTTHFAVPR
jgi:hypothetical protein